MMRHLREKGESTKLIERNIIRKEEKRLLRAERKG